MYVSPAHRVKGMILSRYIGKVSSGIVDPSGGYDLAMDLYGQGCSIVFHAAGDSGDALFKAAQNTGNLGIGCETDQGWIYASSNEPKLEDRAKSILTSMVKRIDKAVYTMAK